MIGIIGDVHLGASLTAGTRDPITGHYSRLFDYYNTLITTIDDMAKTCKTIVFTGDIFEHRNPTMLQQKLFSQALCYALGKGIEQIYIVLGNHDYQRRSSSTTLSYLDELKLAKIKVIDSISRVAIGDNFLYFMPYRDRKSYNVPEYSDAIALISKELKDLRGTDPGKHILVGHMAIEGTFFSEEDTELYADNELMLPKSMFADFNLVIMGHVHTPAQPAPNIYYIGSMEKRGAHESHNKLYALVDLGSSSVDLRKEPCRDFYQYELDFSGGRGPTLSKEIIHELAKVLGPRIEGAILTIKLKIASDDVGYLNIPELNSFVETYKPAYVYPIVPTFNFARMVKIESLEDPDDASTWKKYIGIMVDDEALQDDLINYGLDVIGALKQ